MDVIGDGNLDLVDFAAASPGYYERTRDAGWAGFRAFNRSPNLNWADAKLRFMDLTGDGIADVLITEDDAFVWHPSLMRGRIRRGRTGHVSPWRRRRRLALFSPTATQSIYVADMSGDGLSDIVRIRNGEICYWPNAATAGSAARSPWTMHRGSTSQTFSINGASARRYGRVGHDRHYLSRPARRRDIPQPCGQRLERRAAHRAISSDRRRDRCLGDGLPGARNGMPALVNAVAERNRATAALHRSDAWPKATPAGAAKNHMGAETHIEYASSTEFYLADQAAGTPWITRLPFPVHVVKRVETVDLVSQSRFASRYSYHHGYYDGLEREFRGFARVDQLDTEEFASLER